jgi:hypothetical protein
MCPMYSRELVIAKRDALGPIDSPDGPAAVFAYLISRLAQARTGSVYAEEHDAVGAVPIYLCAEREGLFVKRHPARKLVTYSTVHFSRLLGHMLRSVLAVEGSHAFGWLDVRFDGEGARRSFTLCVRQHAKFGACFQIDQSSRSKGT